MKTNLLMVVSSILLGLAGIVALFAPQELLAALHVPVTHPLPVVIQLMGAFYVAFALTNWTAKDSIIGGIYARPISQCMLSLHLFLDGLFLCIAASPPNRNKMNLKPGDKVVSHIRGSPALDLNVPRCKGCALGRDSAEFHRGSLLIQRIVPDAQASRSSPYHSRSQMPVSSKPS
jgi:hypothetical protein